MFNKLSYLVCLLCLSISPLFAIENDFEFIKNPFPKSISLEANNTSYSSSSSNNIQLASKNTSKIRYAGGFANVFYWNDGIDNGSDIYLTYVTNNTNITIKKLSKTGDSIEDFLDIETSNNRICYTCSTMIETNDDCFIYFFSYENKKVFRASLKTKTITNYTITHNTRSGYYDFNIDDIAVYNNEIFLLSHVNHKDEREICKLDLTDCSVFNNIILPYKNSDETKGYVWDSITFYNGKLLVSGKGAIKGSLETTHIGIMCFVDVNTTKGSTVTIPESQVQYTDSFKEYINNFSYQNDGDNYAYLLAEQQFKTGVSSWGYGYTVIKNQNVSHQYFSFDYKDVTTINTIYADYSGLYIGYTQADRNSVRKAGFLKKTLDGTTDLEPSNTFVVGSENVVLTESFNPMLTCTINGHRQMLIIAPDNPSPQNANNVLYFLPIEENYPQTLFAGETGFTDSVISPKAYSSNYGDYTFKFKYINFQNLAPNSNPVVYLYNKGNLVKSDGFTMNPVDYNDTNYTDGKIYSCVVSASDIGTITNTDNYSYRIKIGDILSKEYPGPFYYGGAIITSYDGTYITPKEKINPNKDISVQMTYTVEAGVNLASEYPRVVIYNKNDLVNPIKINNSTYTVLSPINDANGGYKTSIGKLPIGDYVYNIIARNEFGFENSVSGNFSSIVNDPIITEYEDTFITPSENIDIRSDINIQMTYTGDDSVKLASEYPRVLIYNNNNPTVPIEINSSTYTVLSPIEDSDNGYRANIGKLPIGNYTYKIIAKNEFGLESSVSNTFIVKSIDTTICYNAPNPFNPNRTSTTIRFNTNQDETVTIKIYSLNSKLVFEDSFDARAGTNDYVYKGKDGNGNNLYNGVYLCVIEKQGGKVKCKIAIVK